VTEAAYLHPALSGMSTTLTAAYIAGDTLVIAHVGHFARLSCSATDG
jgi:serine/threonine protein phosphatase PrpC